jgi:nuclear protein localization family protein 4
LEANATEPEVINTATTLSGIQVAIEKPLSDIPSAVKIENTGGKKLWELAAANEEEVDKHWETKDGKIPRKKGMGGCQCGPKSMCDYCMPLEVSLVLSHYMRHASFLM